MRNLSISLLPSRLALVAAGLLALAPAARAEDIRTVQALTQAEFRDLSDDLSAALSFKPMIPSESLGVTGFDVGVGVTGTRLAHRSTWAKASNGDSPSATLPVGVVRVHKGLPYDFDIGASLATTETNARAVGGELRWAVVPGGMLTPAVALRASASVITGIDQIDMNTYGLDVSVSKGFAMFTPYAGAGAVFVRSKPDGSTGLASESFTQTKVYAGLNVNLGLLNLAVETDRTGDATSYGLKAGLRF
ncbi:MAG: hypothetical protein ACM32J_18150 [Rhizobacter sp.]